MPSNFQDLAREMLINALEGGRNSHGDRDTDKDSGGGLGGLRGFAAGAGAAALMPLLARKLGEASGIDGSAREATEGVASKLGDHIGGGLGDSVSGKLDEAGGPAGILSDAVKGVLPFGGGGDDGGDAGGVRGVGKGRRMPVQQSVDIGAPRETVYNQWTQFTVWPVFMHRVVNVSQTDDTTISFTTKIWGKTKEFTAEIEVQRPDERIKWHVTQGMVHTGVVTFHELGPNLTRVLLGLDVDPGGMIEKLARGLRHVKRAARGDLHRFKAFVEMAEHETGAWRGVIEDGEVVEEHDSSYDEDRTYSDLDELMADSGEDEDQEDEDREDEDREDEDREDEESEPQAQEDGDDDDASADGDDESGAESPRRGGSRGRSRSTRRGESGSAQSTRSRGRSETEKRSQGGRKPRSSGSQRSSSGSRSPSGSRSSSGTRSSGTRASSAQSSGRGRSGNSSRRNGRE